MRLTKEQRRAAVRLRRLFPVVVRGKVVVLMVVMAFLVLTLLTMLLLTGDAPSSVLKVCMIYPSMLLLALCGSDTVAILRSTGDLELAVTLAHPARPVLGRLLPILLVAAAQAVATGLILFFILSPWRVALGLLLTILPLAFAATATLYWSLRLRSGGTALMATMVTLIPATIWIGAGELFRESENASTMELWQVALSALRCQAGLLVATGWLAALVRRRFERVEELLDEG